MKTFAILAAFLFSQIAVAADYQYLVFGTNEEGGRCSLLIEENNRYEIEKDEAGKIISKKKVGTFVSYLTYTNDIEMFHDEKAWDPVPVRQLVWSYNYLDKKEATVEAEEFGLEISLADDANKKFSVIFEGISETSQIQSLPTIIYVEVPYRTDLQKTSFVCEMDQKQQ